MREKEVLMSPGAERSLQAIATELTRIRRILERREEREQKIAEASDSGVSEAESEEGSDINGGL